MVWPPRDRLGRPLPVRFNTLTWTRAVPDIFSRFTGVVPDEMWATDVDEDGTPVAIFPCSCHHGDITIRLMNFAECEGCHRFFVHLGKKIKVARPPEGLDAAEEDRSQS